MYKKLSYLIVIGFIFVFIGCGGGGGSSGGENVDCSLKAQNEYMYNHLKKWYLWNDELPQITDFSGYASIDDFLHKIISPKDKWSFTIDEKEFDSMVNSNEDGYGINLAVSSDYRNFVIRYIDQDSPAYKAGLRRGDRILSVNDIILSQDTYLKAYSEIAKKDGIKITYTKKHEENSQEIRLQKSKFTSKTVFYSSVINTNDSNIGYFVFNSFNSTSQRELEQTFNDFNQKNVNKIIVDLRYNGGGLINIVPYLGYMLKKEVARKIAAIFNHNNNQQSHNSAFYFNDDETLNPFNFDEIVFLTSSSTASASEVLINSLKPFVKTYLIGDDTLGKPVGMEPYTRCERHIYPITFRTYNANYQSFSFDGIKANCYVEDNMNFAFGDAQEPMLKAGISYLNTGICEGNLVKNRSRGIEVPMSKYKKIKYLLYK